MSDAWQKGAQRWTVEKRRDLANDPVNLQATLGSINQQKSDGDVATWLPPNRSYRCTYVARIVNVKAAYGLWVTQAEHDAIADILNNCPADLLQAPALPPDTVAPESDHEPAQDASSTEPPYPDTKAPTPETSEPVRDINSPVYYPNCKAAKQAGAAPLHTGDPGYRTDLDGDVDGVACEN